MNLHGVIAIIHLISLAFATSKTCLYGCRSVEVACAAGEHIIALLESSPLLDCEWSLEPCHKLCNDFTVEKTIKEGVRMAIRHDVRLRFWILSRRFDLLLRRNDTSPEQKAKVRSDWMVFYKGFEEFRGEWNEMQGEKNQVPMFQNNSTEGMSINLALTEMCWETLWVRVAEGAVPAQVNSKTKSKSKSDINSDPDTKFKIESMTKQQ